MWVLFNGLITKDIMLHTLLVKSNNLLISTCASLLWNGVKSCNSYTLLEKELRLSILLFPCWYVCGHEIGRFVQCNLFSHNFTSTF